MTDWIKNHWKKVLVHLLALTCFALYAIFLGDPLFDKLEADESEAKLHDIQLPSETQNILYTISESPVETAQELKGWAFISGEGSEGSQTYLVLKSDKNTYIFDSLSIVRDDVSKAFEHLNLNVASSGFYSMLSLRKIRNGCYHIGIYIRKGDMEALQYTDKSLIKSGDSLKLVQTISLQATVSLPPETSGIELNIESIKDIVEDNNSIREIQGWAFIAGRDSKGSKVYLVLKSGKKTHVFDTIVMQRPDVTRHFAETGLDLDSSGFVATIPRESIEKGKYMMGILIENDSAKALQYTNLRIRLD